MALIGRRYIGKRGSSIDWVVIVVALIGIALFFFDRLTTAGVWGKIVALGSGLAFASVALFQREEKGRSPVAAIILGNLLVALAGLPFMFQDSLGARRHLAALVARRGAVWAALRAYAIAIKSVTALETTLVPLLELALNPLWVMLALGERPGRGGSSAERSCSSRSSGAAPSCWARAHGSERIRVRQVKPVRRQGARRRSPPRRPLRWSAAAQTVRRENRARSRARSVDR